MAVTLDWSDADDVPARPANVFLLQGVGEELILVFGHAPPPVATAYMDASDKAKYLASHQIKVSQIVRLSMTIDAAKVVMATLQLNLGDDNGDETERVDTPDETVTGT